MNPQLIIPVYLDTNALLDLLASIEGGFSVVEKVTSQNTSATSATKEASASVGTEFGIPNILNMLKLNIGIGASGKKEESSEDRAVSEKEKYYTYGSLFYRLRRYLLENESLKCLGKPDARWADINLSDFVEVHGTLRLNPLVDSLETMMGLSRYVERFDPLGQLSGQKTSSRGGHQSPKSNRNSQPTQIDLFREFAQEMLNDIERGQTRAFVIDVDESPSVEDNLRAVAVLFLDYFRDKTLYEVRDKQYYLLGKVVRKIEADSNEHVDLLRGSALRAFPEASLAPMFEGLSGAAGLNMPQIARRIEGPAIEILPIAIYV